MKYMMIALLIGALNVSQAQTLDSLINLNQYTCLMVQTISGGDESRTYYIDGTGVMLMFLTDYGSTDYSPFNYNSDGETNTQDLIKALTGFGYSLNEAPPLNLFTPGDIFGEGNQWLTTTNDEISFGWMHRTPADEIDIFYDGWDLVSFKLDIIYLDGSQVFYTFVRL